MRKADTVQDFLTVHTPLLASTANLLGEKELQSMKKTARVLNVARGGVYNEEALLKALDEGWIAGAGLDVFTSEPPVEGSVAARLAAHPKVVSTPHLGASTVEAQENVSMDVCTQVVEILRGGLPTAAVNAPLILPEEYRKLQPFVRLYAVSHSHCFWPSMLTSVGSNAWAASTRSTLPAAAVAWLVAGGSS
jgi:D-3-phosphoglycerate dehydrogenase